MNKFEEIINNINKKEDFIEFVELLMKDFQTNKKDWYNTEVDTYLGGISDWVEVSDNYYINMRLQIPENINWRFFATVLFAGKIYE
jgi:hypothetical protein